MQFGTEIHSLLDATQFLRLEENARLRRQKTTTDTVFVIFAGDTIIARFSGYFAKRDAEALADELRAVLPAQSGKRLWVNEV